MTVEFTFTTSKSLDVVFTNLSVNTEGQPTWDFGDGETSHEENPTHTYSKAGRYMVKLSYEDGGEGKTNSQAVMVSDHVFTTLPDTIYLLINTWLPSDIFGEIDTAAKNQMIKKWQLYIHPLVNHFIPLQDIYNELYYEALENELIMELAAYDYMVLKVNQMVQGLSTYISESHRSSESEEPTGEDEEGKIKHITTGPTEVEYFNPDDYASDALSSIIKAMNPDSVMALLKQQVCMLAERLVIYLPMCQRLPAKRIVPKVVNRRRPGFLGGPDPLEIVKK